MPPRLLLKLRPQTSLAAADSRANLRPLFAASTPAAGSFGLTGDAPAWYLADAPALAALPWDAAHASLGSALGIDDSSILFAEPDLPQRYPDENEINPGGSPFAATAKDCKESPQDNDARKPGPCYAWHLGDNFSQLASARAFVKFTEPRTRIAHIDTGYDKTHTALPLHFAPGEHNFVNGDGTPNNATDPNRGWLIDQSGHGTGTICILAGRGVPQNNGQPIGGAPDAEILPLRIANSVILLYTSSFAAALRYAIDNRCDVVSLSMGGLPSESWNDTVNAAYEAGICIVAASGDCVAGLPSAHVVYPARYHRVIAACGVMADGSPYYNIPFPHIEGSYGPDSCMTAALAAYTPNIPWARIGCPSTIDQNGAGTSAATPQIAAAAALWFEHYKDQLPRDWRRVEAVRYALFQSASNTNPPFYGRGILKARAALDIAPRWGLPMTPPDNDWLPFWRVITGLGLADPPPRERMFNLELAQRYLMSKDLQQAVPDPAITPDDKALRQFLDALIADTSASQALRRLAAARYLMLFNASAPPAAMLGLAPQRAIVRPSPNYEVRNPAFRRLRVYAVDPSFSARLDTSVINQAVLHVRWEKLEPGPSGEYITIEDKDLDGSTYAPVDLDDPRLLAQDGFAPAEGNPQFHQQMCYAVAMNTIASFERGTGRRVLWRPRIDPARPFDDGGYQRQLNIVPHAFQQANAFYDPTAIALRFGYFSAAPDDPGDHVPGSDVFTCLSHDIVAHETTHAILDGMHRRFQEPTNPDVLAFHEAFADIVALMQHFTMLEVLENQIALSRGDLESDTLLGKMAVQFGRANGGRGALRDAIGLVDKTGRWMRQTPDPAAYQKGGILSPHARGALLVAAVFDAFIAIYKSRTVDLYRIYTGGTGLLRPGAIHPDMVTRLAAEAGKSARHVLNMCIRALDYVPPVDITFGEYLRGIVTADADFVPDDPYGYRVAFVEAFRRRGMYPSDLKSLSVDTLLWQSVDLPDAGKRFGGLLKRLKKFADECLYIDDRKKLFERTRGERAALCNHLKAVLKQDPKLAVPLGISPDLPFEIHELRRAERTAADGRPYPQMIVAITQQREIAVPGAAAPFLFHGGSTLVIDLKNAELKYAIRKRIDHQGREESTIGFLAQGMQNPLTARLLAPDRQDRFAVLHALSDLEG